MSNARDPIDPLVPAAGSHPVVKYATWGLIGIGALVVLRWALTLLLNPFLLILLIGGGGLAWETMRKREPASSSSSASAATTARAPAESMAPMPAEIDDPVARSQAELDAFDRRLQEIERMRAEQQKPAR